MRSFGYSFHQSCDYQKHFIVTQVTSYITCRWVAQISVSHLLIVTVLHSFQIYPGHIIPDPSLNVCCLQSFWVQIDNRNHSSYLKQKMIPYSNSVVKMILRQPEEQALGWTARDDPQNKTGYWSAATSALTRMLVNWEAHYNDCLQEQIWALHRNQDAAPVLSAPCHNCYSHASKIKCHAYYIPLLHWIQFWIEVLHARIFKRIRQITIFSSPAFTPPEKHTTGSSGQLFREPVTASNIPYLLISSYTFSFGESHSPTAFPQKMHWQIFWRILISKNIFIWPSYLLNSLSGCSIYFSK